MTAVGVIGAGRAGLSIGLALARAGHMVRLHGRHAKTVPPPLTLTTGPLPAWLREMGVLLLAIPDDGISELAAALAAQGGIGARQAVLHLSGALSKDALQPLAASGAALGSLHPLQTLSDPATAPQRLKGAIATVEGDPRAVEIASNLARDVGLVPVPIPGDQKARYHAAAVFAANFPVALAGVAQRLFVAAGLPDEVAGKALAALMSGALENLRAAGPAGALTGPVARGDVETIRRHLRALQATDADLYRALSRAALELASLDPDRRRAIQDLLR